MKKFTKILSMVLLVAMCVSMFAVSASAAAVHVKQTSDTPAADGSVTYTVSNPSGAAITDVSWNTDDGAVPADGYWNLDGSTLTVSGSDWSVVSSVSVSFSNGLSVTVNCAKGAADYANDGNNDTQPEPTPAPHTHTWTDVAEVKGDCKNPGTKAHSVCACGAYLVDYQETTDASALVLPGEHDFEYVAVVNPTCKEVGYEEHAKCSICGALRQYGVDIADLRQIQIPVVDHKYKDGVCEYCGIADPTAIDDPEIVASNGKHTFVFDGSNNNFVYTLKNFDLYDLVNVYLGDDVLYYSEYDFSSRTGRITLNSRVVGNLMGSAPSAEVTFELQARADSSIVKEVRGFYITNESNTSSEEIQVEGLSSTGYIQGTDMTVTFRTNISDTSRIKIYSFSKRADMTPVFEPVEVYYDMYTYTFSNDYLDSLPTGNYDVRIYFGESNGDYISVGQLTVYQSNANVPENMYLRFVNSTTSSDETFKYVSGDEVPRLYCPLFLFDGARLQVSTNNGKSWSNVNVHSYMIEPNKKGYDTSHAWIGSDYLDSLNANTIYYFRVVVPASLNHSGSDWVSNTVSITTGPTLKAVDTAKHVINSTKNLRFVSSEKIAKVYVGNVQLTDENDFNVSNDGKTVTLSPSFLNKRTAGSTYTIKVLTTTGEYASTTFQILTTAQASASPRTGDTSNIGLWTAVLMLSAGAAVAVLPRLKKED